MQVDAIMPAPTPPPPPFPLPPLLLQGDNDPVDVVEIGSETCEMGGVYPVKPLGEFKHCMHARLSLLGRAGSHDHRIPGPLAPARTLVNE